MKIQLQIFFLSLMSATLTSSLKHKRGIDYNSGGASGGGSDGGDIYGGYFSSSGELDLSSLGGDDIGGHGGFGGESAGLGGGLLVN
ncbi:hypothetical protein QE152_g35088 [Popillia japonica]|uniref:Glycine-rich protein n=1 Tax=Popillia japonica TaxID=7064 RepID=A0AAW1IRW3_POPJA